MILEIFWTVSLIKSPCVLRWSWILNECNLSWKFVKYCILYEVCMIKTAPHSTLSPQMWCIKKNKRMVCTHPDLLARICKLVERKKIRPNLFSTPYLRWSRAIIALKCDRRLFLGEHIRLHQLDTRFVLLQNHLAFPSEVTWMCPWVNWFVEYKIIAWFKL